MGVMVDGGWCCEKNEIGENKAPKRSEKKGMLFNE
jgi:hypothetical protein